MQALRGLKRKREEVGLFHLLCPSVLLPGPIPRPDPTTAAGTQLAQDLFRLLVSFPPSEPSSWGLSKMSPTPIPGQASWRAKSTQLSLPRACSLCACVYVLRASRMRRVCPLRACAYLLRASGMRHGNRHDRACLLIWVYVAASSLAVHRLRPGAADLGC